MHLAGFLFICNNQELQENPSLVQDTLYYRKVILTFYKTIKTSNYKACPVGMFADFREFIISLVLPQHEILPQ